MLAILIAAATAAAPPPAAELRFIRNGSVVRRLDRAALRRSCGVQTVEIDDPYYAKKKRFIACPLADVARLGFGVAASELANEDVLLRAADGYEKPTRGARLAEAGGFLALADADRAKGDDPGFEPIDRKQVDPGPFYVVWTGPKQREEQGYPWPYQLVEIAIENFEARFPHVTPRKAAAGSPPWRGFELFRAHCFSCHAVNGEGGKIGPDLNVPQSIVEYRPAEQIRAYIRDPRTFRYSSMPAHPNLTDADLDALLAYFTAMSREKHDPLAKEARP
jgi:mono/diheme cytochrome c family protein